MLSQLLLSLSLLPIVRPSFSVCIVHVGKTCRIFVSASELAFNSVFVAVINIYGQKLKIFNHLK